MASQQDNQNVTSRKTRAWSAEEDRRLLLALLASIPDVQYNYSSIALYSGRGVTKDGADHRFRILKKEMKKLREEVSNGERTAPATPAKRARPASVANLDDSPSKKAAKTPAKKGGRKGKNVGNGEGESLGEHGPSKPNLKEGVKNPVMGVEEADVDSDDDY